MSAPKIVAAWVDRDGWMGYLDETGEMSCVAADRRDARLAKSGQRAIWPEGHGVAVIEDIPKPEPLPNRWVNLYDGDPFWGFPDRAAADDGEGMKCGWTRIGVLHLWTDADGVDHAEIERVQS